jgi:hypothetical protein
VVKGSRIWRLILEGSSILKPSRSRLFQSAEPVTQLTEAPVTRSWEDNLLLMSIHVSCWNAT